MDIKLLFFLAKYNKKIIASENNIEHIFEKHKEIVAVWHCIGETLYYPDDVRKSIHNNRVWLYYRFYKIYGKYLTVIVQINNGEGKLLTSYLTDRIMPGEKV